MTEWMESQPGEEQRVCFFTMVDNGKAGLGEVTCMETQKFYKGKVRRPATPSDS